MKIKRIYQSNIFQYKHTFKQIKMNFKRSEVFIVMNLLN